MSKEIYKELRVALSNRAPGKGGVHDIPEFYDLVEELFTPEEAAVASAQPEGTFTAKELAKKMGKNEREIKETLESMANKGTCFSFIHDGIRYYQGSVFQLIIDRQFLRGTFTEKDKRLAKLKKAYNGAIQGKTLSDVVHSTPLPVYRVISIEETIESRNEVHTYDQVSHFIENSDPIAAATCYCRHSARLVDSSDVCNVPMEVCMAFNYIAAFIIERGIGRKISREEAYEILEKAEESNLIHLSTNIKNTSFICNCCTCHCIAFTRYFNEANPAQSIHSRFQQETNPELCKACGTCVGRCPMKARSLVDEKAIKVNMDRCIGCGLCATGCPEGAAVMVQRPDTIEPLLDMNAFIAEWTKLREEERAKQKEA